MTFPGLIAARNAAADRYPPQYFNDRTRGRQVAARLLDPATPPPTIFKNLSAAVSAFLSRTSAFVTFETQDVGVRDDLARESPRAHPPRRGGIAASPLLAHALLDTRPRVRVRQSVFPGDRGAGQVLSVRSISRGVSQEEGGGLGMAIWPFKSGDDDGRHRQTGSQVYGGADQSSGALDPGAVTPIAASAIHAQYRAMLAQATLQRASSGLAAQLVQARQLFLQQAFEAEQRTPELKSDGIRMGEIIAWRTWKIKHGWLYSVTAEEEWAPATIIEAHEIGPVLGQGVHAFKHRLKAIEYAEYFSATDYEAYLDKTINGTPCVIGQVALWGQIYEFEKGWHGQYARIHSLDMTFGDCPPIEELRKTYGLTEAA